VHLPLAGGRNTTMANYTNSHDQGQPSSPLNPHESHALDDIGKWLVREDPALASMLGTTRPTPRRWHGLVTALTYVLPCAVLAPLVVYLSVLLAGFAWSRAMPAGAVAAVLGTVGLTALVFLWLLFSEGDQTPPSPTR
jgi:hypothetical protein